LMAENPYKQALVSTNEYLRTMCGKACRLAIKSFQDLHDWV